jgi:L-fuculose-phosphate aldolase
MTSIIESLIEAGRFINEAGLNAGTAGNLSARLEDGRVAITRRRTRKTSLSKENFVVFDPVRAGAEDLKEASSEHRLHTASYLADGDVRSVIHAHSPALTAIGLRRSSFPPALPELELVVGSIVINPFEPSGTALLSDGVGRAVGRGAGVIILKRHGAVTVGRSVAQALDRLELAENAARTILLAER